MNKIKRFLRKRYRIKGFDKETSERELETVIDELRDYEKVIIHDLIHIYDDYLELKPDDTESSEDKISDITRTIGDEPEYKIGVSCSIPQSPIPKIMNITAWKQRNSDISIDQLYFHKDFVSNGSVISLLEEELNGKDLLTRLQIGAVYLTELSNLYNALDYECRLIRKQRLECAERVRAEVKKTFYFTHIYKLKKNVNHILKKVEGKIERPDETIFNPS